MLCVPTGSVSTVRAAWPSMTSALPIALSPAAKATVPPAAGATCAVSVTAPPTVIDSAEALRLVVVSAATTGGKTASHCSAVTSTGTRATMASSSGLPCAHQTMASYACVRSSFAAGTV